MKIDDERVRGAIREAEARTGTRIAVHIAHHRVDDALEHAAQQYHRNRLHEHDAGNTVLFVVAPKSRRVAVYGGRPLHERVGEAFWQGIVDEMTPAFAQDRPTDALLRGIQALSDGLSAEPAT